MHVELLKSVQACRVRDLYRWVLGAAGEGNSTLFPTGIPIGTVKIDVQVPVVCSERTAALPLKSGGEGKKMFGLLWLEFQINYLRTKL